MLKVFPVCLDGSFGGSHPMVIDDPCTEPEAARRYVRERGVPGSGKVAVKSRFLGEDHFWILDVALSEQPEVIVTTGRGQRL